MYNLNFLEMRRVLLCDETRDSDCDIDLEYMFHGKPLGIEYPRPWSLMLSQDAIVMF